MDPQEKVKLQGPVNRSECLGCTIISSGMMLGISGYLWILSRSPMIMTSHKHMIRVLAAVPAGLAITNINNYRHFQRVKKIANEAVEATHADPFLLSNKILEEAHNSYRK